MSDLFEFFKDNESQLYEPPPAQAWKKLEAQLERKKRRKRRGIRFMQIGFVVVTVLVLLMLAYIVWQKSR